MKIFFLLLFLNFPRNLFSQVIYDPAVTFVYQEVFLRQPAFMKENLRSMPPMSGYNGIAFFTTYRADTLVNKAKKSNIEIVSADGNMQGEVMDNSIPGAFVLVRFSVNEIKINLGSGFSYFLEHSILNGKGISFLTVESESPSLKLNAGDTLAYKVRIPARLKKITLSKKDPKKGDELFGEVEVESEPWFEISDNDPGSYVQKRMVLHYVFKVTM